MFEYSSDEDTESIDAVDKPETTDEGLIDDEQVTKLDPFQVNRSSFTMMELFLTSSFWFINSGQTINKLGILNN